VNKNKIAVGNAAGSAGKSTTVTSLAAIAAEDGKKVLIVDGDAQATATRWVGIDPLHCDLNIGNVLLKEATADEAIIPTPVEGVFLLPAATNFDGVVTQLAAMRGAERRMRNFLRDVHGFGLVLIDCPGSLNIITASAIVAADHVVTVATPTMKEVEGTPRFMRLVDDLADEHDLTIRVDGIVPCMVPPANAGAIYRESYDLLVSGPWADRITPMVRRSTRVPDSYASRVPLPILYPQEPVTIDYRGVYEWLTTRRIL